MVVVDWPNKMKGSHLPFQIESKGDVLFLILNSPNSIINIFNVDAAMQLNQILSAVSRKNTSMLVIQSSKPSSFINGAGLLLATAAMKSQNDALKYSSIIHIAIQNLRKLEIPTVSVVRGS